MSYEKEITVEVETSLEELNNILKKNNFEAKEEFDLIDIYMIKRDYEITEDYLEALKQCVLIRNIIEENKNTKKITYKYKEYNECGDIVKDGKIECEVQSIEEAKNLLEAIGYRELIKIDDHMIVYANETSELAVQLVNNKHIYIEMEEKCSHVNRRYNGIEELKQDLQKYNIPIKDDNYFAKKAEIELKEILNS